jgi:hypothetical protein
MINRKSTSPKLLGPPVYVLWSPCDQCGAPEPRYDSSPLHHNDLRRLNAGCCFPGHELGSRRD